MKRIESPIPQFPGYVILPDHYLFDRLIPFEEGAAEENGEIKVTLAVKMAAALVQPMVDEWHIDGIENGVIPGTPKVPVMNLVSWLIDEIWRVVLGADAVNPPTGGASTNG